MHDGLKLKKGGLGYKPNIKEDSGHPSVFSEASCW